MNQLLYYFSCSNDEPILNKICECLQSHSLKNKAEFSIIALYEAPCPHEISVNYYFEEKLIKLIIDTVIFSRETGSNLGYF